MSARANEPGRGKPEKPRVVVDLEEEREKKKAPWNLCLVKNKQGAYAACVSNFISILVNEDVFADRLGFNEFTGRIEKLQPIKWHEHDTASGDEAGAGPLTKDDVTRVAGWIGRQYTIPIQALGPVDAAISVVAKRRTFHPVRDWLDSIELKWDGKERIDTSLIRYVGAPDTRYVRAVGRILPLGAVARIYKPGAKVDTTVVFEGLQDLGKSSFVRELASEPWFLETSMNLGTKDAFQDLRGKWIVEFAELNSLSDAQFGKVDAFLTQRKDTYRSSYGRDSEDHQRQCVFTATTNRKRYLRNQTGNRRYLPIEATKIDLDLVRREREQYWAEAVVRYKRGERWHVTDGDGNLLQDFRDEQEDRREIHPWEPVIAAWLAKPNKGGPTHNGKKYKPIPYDASNGVLTTDVLLYALKIEPAKQTKPDEMCVASILTNVLHYTRGERETVDGIRVRRYRPPAGPVGGGPGGPDAADETAEKEPPPNNGPPGPPISGSHKGKRPDPRGSKKPVSGGPGGPARTARRGKAKK